MRQRLIGRELRLAFCVGVVLLFVTWTPRLPPTPGPGLDSSWEAALTMGLQSGLAWGRDIVFTYGPLGFLEVPRYWTPETGALSFLYVSALALALFVILWLRVSRALGVVAGSAVLAAVGANLGDPVLPLAFAAGAWALSQSELTTRDQTYLAVGLGLFSGLEILVKLNTGATVFVLALVTILALPVPHRQRLMSLSTFLCAALVATIALWLAAVQPIAALPDYAQTSFSVSAGYASALLSTSPGLSWQYPAFGVIFCLGLAMILVGARAWTLRARLGAVSLWTVVSFANFKEGFIRHDPTHSLIPFAGFLACLLVVPWPVSRKARAAALAAAALPFIVIVHTAHQGLSDIFSPVSRAQNAWRDFKLAVFPTDQRGLEEAGRADVLSSVDRIPEQTLRLLRGQSVWVASYEETAAWAYRLRWRPVPVFQLYQVDTHLLDVQGARFLLGHRAPERVLVGPSAPGRVVIETWQAPQVIYSLICRYPHVVLGPVWSVLLRGQNRCGRPKLVTTVDAHLGQEVQVPPLPVKNAMMSVRITGLQVSGLEWLRQALYKPLPRQISFDGGPQYLFIPGTAGDATVLSVPNESRYGRYVPQAHFLRVLVPGGAQRTVRFSFYETTLDTGSYFTRTNRVASTTFLSRGSSKSEPSVAR